MPRRARLRRRAVAAAVLLLDVAMAGCVTAAWLGGALGLWLHLGYLALAAAICLRPGGRRSLVRLGLLTLGLSLVGLVGPHVQAARLPDLVQVAFMALLALLLAAYAERRSRALAELHAAHRAASDHAVELERAHQEAQTLSRVDALTGVFNRRYATEMLVRELERANRGQGAPGVLLVDCDHFKRINDFYGHGAGDEVLAEVARRLRGAVRAYDCVARWGGEEFCIVLPAVPDESALEDVAEALRGAVVAQPVVIGGERRIQVSASIGAVRATVGLWTADALVDAADRALYAAKRLGRDRVCLHSQLGPQAASGEEPEAISIAQALALSASVREGMPELHNRQVAEVAGRIAAQMGLPDDLRMRCRLGGWLHDVGKVAVPDRILAKRAPLTAPEWEAMRRHPEVGEQIVLRSAAVAEAAEAVRHHHERWDGAGYPDGLAGDAIPLEARIVAAADAFAAMAADRAHRRRRDLEAALEELRANAGTQFDPRVVGALCATLAARDCEQHERVARLQDQVAAGETAA